VHTGIVGRTSMVKMMIRVLSNILLTTVLVFAYEFIMQQPTISMGRVLPIAPVFVSVLMGVMCWSRMWHLIQMISYYLHGIKQAAIRRLLQMFL
jgi:hypothetical protein